MSKLKTLREQLGISPQTLADKAGVSRQYIWLLEKGDIKNPSVRHLMSIAEVLNVDIKELIDE